MIQPMDNRLERYEGVQDAEYEAYLKESEACWPTSLSVEFWRTERICMMREISRIEKHLAEDEIDKYVTRSAWHERLVDCRMQLEKIEARLRQLEEVAN